MIPVQIQKRMDFCDEARRGSIDWAGDVIIIGESRRRISHQTEKGMTKIGILEGG
jgi:hypothetical protein